MSVKIYLLRLAVITEQGAHVYCHNIYIGAQRNHYSLHSRKGEMYNIGGGT